MARIYKKKFKEEKVFNLRLEMETYKKLETISDDTGNSVNNIVNESIEKYLVNREEKK